MFGPSRRVLIFLWSLLQPATRERYVSALTEFSDFCDKVNVRWNELAEEQQDFVLAEFLVYAWEEVEGTRLQSLVDCVAAAQKLYLGRQRFTASLKVLTAFQSLRPPQSALPLQDVVVHAMAVVLFTWGQLQVALIILLCFCALLRI